MSDQANALLTITDTTLPDDEGVVLDLAFSPPRLVAAPLATHLWQICRHWRIVAIQDPSWDMRWTWPVADGQQEAPAAFKEAVDAHVVRTVQGRLPDGSVALYARLGKGREKPASFRRPRAQAEDVEGDVIVLPCDVHPPRFRRV
jgi:hypothetical protein